MIGETCQSTDTSPWGIPPLKTQSIQVLLFIDKANNITAVSKVQTFSCVHMQRHCIAFAFKSKQMCFRSAWCNILLDLKVLHKQYSVSKTDLALLWSYLYFDLCDCDLCWVESGEVTPPWDWKEPVTSTLWINNSLPCFQFSMLDVLSYIRVCHCCLMM